jgi:hypothetical protein
MESQSTTGDFNVWAILGWLITALAVSLGAPFWFDTLDTILNIRGAGPKPETPSSDRGKAS